MRLSTNFLQKADQVFDYIPGLSTLTNLIELFQKCVLLQRKQQVETSKSHHYTYSQHLQQKSFCRCVVLLVPVIGNALVALYDYVKANYPSKDERFMPTQSDPLSTPHSNPSPTIEGLAEDRGRQLGKRAKSLLIGKKEAGARDTVLLAHSQADVIAGCPAGRVPQLAAKGDGKPLQASSLSEKWDSEGEACCEHSLEGAFIALYPALQTKAGLINIHGRAENCNLIGESSGINIDVSPKIYYNAGQSFRLSGAELNQKLKELLQLKCPDCIQDLAGQGHKFLAEATQENALQGAFYLATAYELHLTLSIQGYEFKSPLLEQYLDEVEKSLIDGKSLLHYFAAYENKSIFMYLFDRRPAVKLHLNSLVGRVIKETPLHMAIKGGCVPVVQYLLEQGAAITPGRYGEYAKTVLHIAIEYGYEEIVGLLLEHQDIQEILNLPQGRDQSTALHLAAQKSHFSLLLKLLKRGAHTELQNLLRRTPLEALLEHESLDFKTQDECACLLLSKKTADFFRPDNPDLKRCFINALVQGLLGTAKKLAENGLPPLEKHECSFLEIVAEAAFYRTHTLSPQPIEIPAEKRAAYRGLIYWLLTEKKVNPDQKFKNRYSFLIHQVCESGHPELWKLFIKLKADLEKLDNSHNNALHYACQSRFDCVEMVEAVWRDAPALRTAKNSCAQTPLHLAARRGNAKIVKYLLAQMKQHEIDQQDDWGNTPLHLAIIEEERAYNQTNENYLEVIKALLAKGASLSVVNKEGKTASMLAFAAGTEAIIEVLSQNKVDF